MPTNKSLLEVLVACQATQLVCNEESKQGLINLQHFDIQCRYATVFWPI